jgi:hypothetical protein
MGPDGAFLRNIIIMERVVEFQFPSKSQIYSQQSTVTQSATTTIDRTMALVAVETLVVITEDQYHIGKTFNSHLK